MRANKKALVRDLECRCAKLRQQLEKLDSVNSALVLNHRVLMAWADSLAYVQHCKALQDDFALELASLTQQLKDLQHQEQSLLQQLPSWPEVDQRRAQATSGFPVNTLAPPGDPMAFFRDIVSRPFLPVDSLTARGLSERYRATVLELGVLLHQLDGPPVQQHSPLGSLKILVDRHLHLLASLILTGKQSVVAQFMAINCDTMEVMQDPSQLEQLQRELTDGIVTALKLTQQQEDAIVQGLDMYARIIASVTREARQLQQAAGDHGDSSSSGCDISSRDFHAEVVAEARRRALLAQQEQSVSRLQVLLRKEYLMLMAAVSWFLGCMSWAQVARVAVLGWPHPVSLDHLAAAMQRRYEGRLQCSYQDQLQ